jgi:superfamily II DNA or RNA helicase/very-short-patch-repair endonuclease
MAVDRQKSCVGGAPVEGVNRHSPAHLKIALFRARFRGREDVYARRFENPRTGRSGYAPACANEWVRGLCEKPQIACADCPNRQFLPVGDEVIRWHLTGHDGAGSPFVLGVYPLLQDERCHFLAADFDGEHWADDALAFLATCRRLGWPAALERSRSGQGGHVWLFFEEAVPAALARGLGAHLLTETLERHRGPGLRSYDRFFPNQDTLPRGGFGNLIALPMQGEARQHGNSLFVDDELRPHADPWAFLASMPLIALARLEAGVRSARAQGRILGPVAFVDAEHDEGLPWELLASRRKTDRAAKGPFPEVITVVLADQLHVPKAGLSPSLQNRLVRLAAFPNPEFHRAQAMRLSTYGKPRIVECAEDHPDSISLPRGCFDGLRELLGSCGVRLDLRDERCGGVAVEWRFQGRLRPEQEAAAAAMLADDFGVLAATTAFGKTVLAAWLIAQRGVNTLVLTHRQQLLEQWVERLSEFLGIPTKEIGRLGGGRKRLTGQLDVALLQSLVRKGAVDERVAGYGHLVIDECHHLSAWSFEQVARRAKARYVTGLSATVVRKDGLQPIVFMQCGPVRYRVDARQQAAARPFSHHVLVRPTGFRPPREPDADPRVEFQTLCAELAASEPRNRRICDEVVGAVGEGRFPLVLTERTEHVELLTAMLRERGARVVVLRGGLGTKLLRTALSELAENGSSESPTPVIVATGKFVGEGFDHARLDTLFLAMPVSWRGTIAQYVGRLHRLHEGKREARVVDYADLEVPMLARMFDRRCEGYEASGYTILLPASAIPGWPESVPLPVDAAWKRDYAASVQRLIRDGVDAPLAGLFVATAREPEPGSEGIARARSASEAFLFRRLESLPETRARFRLNAHLPIPFDGWGRMEVDFFCAEARLVVEIDGAQHLGDPEAYRRDRRKDALLQEHGYLVLRFLAEDVGKRLDAVLNGVTRALAARGRRSAPS